MLYDPPKRINWGGQSSRSRFYMRLVSMIMDSYNMRLSPGGEREIKRLLKQGAANASPASFRDGSFEKAVEGFMQSGVTRVALERYSSQEYESKLLREPITDRKLLVLKEEVKYSIKGLCPGFCRSADGPRLEGAEL